jgi:trans-aconitate 2-methyltransferase
MTEWNAGGYYRQSALQKWVADEHLASLTLADGERVLDVGCGDGKITAEIADRLPRGSVLGVDPSTDMIAFAREHFRRKNLDFAAGDATRLAYREEFDLAVSFNALHWVVDQATALSCIRGALRRGGRAFLELVPQAPRRSIEDVLEATRQSAGWARYFAGYRTPYLHPSPEQYASLAEGCGLRVERIETERKQWDFGTREGFVDWARITFVEWTRMIPEAERDRFIGDVLDTYAQVGNDAPPSAFVFYQMEVELRREEIGQDHRAC